MVSDCRHLVRKGHKARDHVLLNGAEYCIAKSPFACGHFEAKEAGPRALSVGRGQRQPGALSVP